jgi:hypothetical protein
MKLVFSILKKMKKAFLFSILISFPGIYSNTIIILTGLFFAADTNNKTLELLDYSNPYLASNWRAGCVLGTPGLDPSWCNTEGIYEYDNLFNLKVSPVPANNQLQLQFEVKKPDHIALEIFDSQSVLIENRAINIPISGLHTYILNTKSYSNGMYFIRLTNSKTSVETKFIILKK